MTADAVRYLEILATGPLALLQDRGRPGHAQLGVTSSGAADRAAFALANRLLANVPEAAAVEVTLGGLAARVVGGELLITVTGADPQARIDGIPFGPNTVQRVGDGQLIAFGTPRTGLRSYLGVRGGVDVPPVLGSRSYDTLAAIGPVPLRPGEHLPVGRAGRFPEVDLAPVAPIDAGALHLRVVPGPRATWMADPDALTATAWRVSDRSDRIGVRLLGQPLQHRDAGRQLPSEGAMRGAIQLPPNGLPVILGPDHPVTGGYPVIGVVLDQDTDRLAQARPGQGIRLHWHDPDGNPVRSGRTPADPGKNQG